MTNQDDQMDSGSKTELWDIARYVEDHPDDFEQRWRLAKKLYTAWEYRLALEHLQVLKNEWQRKLNVIRYLAATYYRLGRYADAIAELKAAIDAWPQEIGVREQLARVLETAGEEEEAARAWRKIKELDAKHPIAESAAKRLDAKRQPTAAADLRLRDSDSGIDLSPGHACPNCGAVNSEGFDRCWQCHAPLAAGGPTPRPTPPPEEPKVPILTPETATLAAGIMVVGLLALALYLSLRLLWVASGPEAPRTITSIWELYTYDLAWSRVVTGTLLIVACPAVLWGMLQLIKPEEPVPGALLILAGLLPPSLGYVCTWLSPSLLFLAFLLPAIISLAIIAGAFGLGFARAINVWILHLAAMVALTAITFTLVEAAQLERIYNPFSEIPAVIRFAGERLGEEAHATHTIPGHALPLEQRLRWLSTGSGWLDQRARHVTFTVVASPPGPSLFFDIQDDAGLTIDFRRVEASPWSYTYDVEPGKIYRVVITGPEEGVTARLQTSGMFILELLEPDSLAGPSDAHAAAASPAAGTAEDSSTATRQ